MTPSAYDLKEFYQTRTGRVVRVLLQNRIRDFWPDMHDLRVLGQGYAVPYMRMFMNEAERVVCVMPEQHSAHQWPSGEQNYVCLSETYELPFESNSVDRIISIHDLEHAQHAGAHLHEIWRVLKSNGRLLMVVPGRTGFWSHAEWTPFGQGTPFSALQVKRILSDNKFVHEKIEGALYAPPIKRGLPVKLAQGIETLGQKLFPFGAGVYVVEASKQIYARSGPRSGLKLGVNVPSLIKKTLPQG